MGFSIGRVFRLLQALGELAGQHVFLGSLGFDRSAEFRFDGIFMLAEMARGVVQIDRGRPHRCDMRQAPLRDARSTVSFALQHGQSISNVSWVCFAMRYSTPILDSVKRD